MALTPRRRKRTASGRSGLTLYVLTWALGATVVAVAALALLGRGDRDTVALPPIRQIELSSAARAAGCTLRDGDRGPEVGLPRDSPALRRPARAGVYEQPPDPSLLGAALRRGLVVIQYGRTLADEEVERLQALQQTVPAGTVLAPERIRTRYEVTIAGWRRLLACPRFTDATVDAMRLFRGRFIGSGPDRSG